MSYVEIVRYFPTFIFPSYDMPRGIEKIYSPKGVIRRTFRGVPTDISLDEEGGLLYKPRFNLDFKPLIGSDSKPVLMDGMQIDKRGFLEDRAYKAPWGLLLDPGRLTRERLIAPVDDYLKERILSLREEIIPGLPSLARIELGVYLEEAYENALKRPGFLRY